MIEGTIIKGVGGLYTVDTPEGEFRCNPRGIFRKDGISPLVGDIVSVEVLDEKEKTGVIEAIHQRKSYLSRPKVANVNQALVVFAIKQPDLHLDLLDRFILNCEKAGLEIVVCINKMDLISRNNFSQIEEIRDIYTKAGYKFLLISTATGEGMDELKEALNGKSSVFAGPSGAGKSSVSNLITPDYVMETGEVSRKIGRGKHTTRHTQLIKIGGGYIVDSPGFSSVNLEGITRENLSGLFPEFRGLAKDCRFAGCSHIEEPDCAVKKELENGGISQIRYDRYVGIYKEIE